MYADARQELPPLQQAAMRILDTVRQQGTARGSLLKALDDRFPVYMLGRNPGAHQHVPLVPRANQDRTYARRPARPATPPAKSCKCSPACASKAMICRARRPHRHVVLKDSSECGLRPWFRWRRRRAWLAPSAPLLHWRLCHVYDWLYFEPER
ncbi:MAG: hypothetical protein IPM07_30435, partial [Anaerolineales bacterium]|nr:hypothetical protein [Anaerolineales bacterium]